MWRHYINLKRLKKNIKKLTLNSNDATPRPEAAPVPARPD